MMKSEMEARVTRLSDCKFPDISDIRASAVNKNNVFFVYMF